MFAFRIDNGERICETALPGYASRPQCSPAQSGALSAIPGAIFSGSLDGRLAAYSATNGKIIWDSIPTGTFGPSIE
jgi:polyvinyl alcohol dehydrogenase (cytochrome)